MCLVVLDSQVDQEDLEDHSTLPLLGALGLLVAPVAQGGCFVLVHQACHTHPYFLWVRACLRYPGGQVDQKVQVVRGVLKVLVLAGHLVEEARHQGDLEGLDPHILQGLLVNQGPHRPQEVQEIQGVLLGHSLLVHLCTPAIHFSLEILQDLAILNRQGHLVDLDYHHPRGPL